jgi:hypothetical protein
MNFYIIKRRGIVNTYFFLLDAYTPVCAVDTECLCITQVNITLKTVK